MKKFNKYLLIGISSKYGSRHIPILDYDRIDINDLLSDLFKLQSKFSLPNFYVLRTSKGHYSAVCFKTLTFRKYMEVLLMSKSCGWFKYFTFVDKRATIRISMKPDKVSSVIDIACVSNSKFAENVKIKELFFNLLSIERENCYPCLR